ncbi:hypothetical protein L6R50_16770 [Myxococcota bacterium]|nr:hypothetical protein [Myxococcota bacterium]
MMRAGSDPSASLEPILVLFGQQADGCSYALHPRSRRIIDHRFPGVHPAPNVFIGYDTLLDFERIHGPMWPQVATMLTGLTREQIRDLGGAVLFDPVNQREVARIF